MNRATRRKEELKFTIAMLEVGIFTEPFLIHCSAGGSLTRISTEFMRISNLPSMFPTIDRVLRFYWPQVPGYPWSLTTALSEIRFRRIVPSTVSHPVRRRLGLSRDSNLNTAKLRIRQALRWIVSQQILRAQFLADLAEGVIQLHHRSRIVVLAARIFRELDQRMLASGLASRAVLDWHHDNAVDQSLGLFRGARRLFVIDFADGVAAVGNE